MASVISSDSLKLMLGVFAFIALSLGDFFFAHRLPVDADIFLLAGAVYPLGVHVAVNQAITQLRG